MNKKYVSKLEQQFRTDRKKEYKEACKAKRIMTPRPAIAFADKRFSKKNERRLLVED